MIHVLQELRTLFGPQMRATSYRLIDLNFVSWLGYTVMELCFKFEQNVRVAIFFRHGTKITRARAVTRARAHFSHFLVV